MPRPKPLEPTVPLTIRVPRSLREQFAAACLRNAIPATYALHQLMRDYIRQQPTPAAPAEDI